ncbi:Proline-rich protein 32 [Vulpes lagopus]
MSLQCSSSMPKGDVEPWGHHRVLLRPPLNVLTDLAREQLERPSETAGACIPVDSSRAHKHPYGPPPAVAEESLATAEGGPRHPVENWPRSLPLSSSTPGLPSRPTAHCFISPRPPSFSPFLAMPIAFAPPPIFGPPLPSYFANFPSWGMPAPAPSNRENN